MKFYIDARTSISLHFDQVADLQIDGAFEFGWRPEGWDVMGTPMLVGQRPRSDGRLVYVIELSNSLICIASLPGTLKSVPSPPPAVFVIDGHDIDLYPDAEGAAREIEGYNAKSLEYFGADGTVYRATVEGPEWGAVTLHRTDINRLDELILLLRDEAESRGLSLPPGTPDEPEAIWGALLVAQQEHLVKRRSERRRWWMRRPKNVAPTK